MKLVFLLVFFLSTLGGLAQLHEPTDSSRLAREFRSWERNRYEKKILKETRRQIRRYVWKSIFNPAYPKMTDGVKFCFRNRRRIKALLFPGAKLDTISNGTLKISIMQKRDFSYGYLYVDSVWIGELGCDSRVQCNDSIRKDNSICVNFGHLNRVGIEKNALENIRNHNLIRFKMCGEFWFFEIYKEGDSYLCLPDNAGLYKKYPMEFPKSAFID